MVGLSTDLADYYLKNPSSAYSKIYSDLADKVKLTGVVYGILEEVMEKGKFVLLLRFASGFNVHSLPAQEHSTPFPTKTC